MTICTSLRSIFLPKYSGVRPTIRPATKIASTTNSSSSTNNLTTADSHNVADSGNTSASWWQANSDSHAVANSGNTSTSLSDTGNTSSFMQWLTSLSDSGNTTDTHAVSNSGNSQSSFSYTGTDGGIGHIADVAGQGLQAQAEAGLGTVQALAQWGQHLGDQSAYLAGVTAQNSMLASSHMLDLTGELIDRIATGAAVTANAQTAAVQATSQAAGQAASDASGTAIKAAWIAGGLALLAAVFH